MRTSLRLAGALALASFAAPSAFSQGCLSTLFAANNGGSVGGAVYFDVNVTQPILVNGFETNFDNAVGTAIGLDFYMTAVGVSSVGNEANAAAWTLMGSGAGVSAGLNAPSVVPLGANVLINPGLYGFALVAIGDGHRYTSSPVPNVFSDAFLSIILGAASNVPFSGTPFTPRGWNGSICYLPANGIFANFTASTTSGASPLSVNFTDTTFSSPNPVVAWSWDLDGDGNVDSNAQNPSFTYGNCGAYDVTLTATDSQNNSSTETKVAYIFVDPQLVVTADFTAAAPNGLAPHNVNFQDLSTGNPTTWDWDLNGDGISDSNLQNPSFNYTVPGSYTVVLTASNACFGDTVRKVSYVNVVGGGTNQPADVLNYQWNEVRGPNIHNVATGNTYPAFGVTGGFAPADPGRPDYRGNEPGFGCNGFVTGLVGNNDVDAGGPVSVTGSFTIMFWMRRDPSSTTTNPFGYAFGDGTFRAFAAGAAGTGITFRGSAIGNVDSGFDVINTPGVWQHVAIVVDDTNGVAEWYNNGFPSGNQVMFTPGTFAYTGTNTFWVGSNSGGSEFTDNYDMDDFRFYSSALSANDIFASSLNEQASVYAYDQACTDSNGFTPAIVTGGGAPFVGNAAFTVQATGLEPLRPCAFYLGVFTSLGGVLPIDLAGSGLYAAGCALSVTPDVVVNFLTDGSGNSPVYPTAVPLDPVLAGGHAYGQVIGTGSGALWSVSAPVDFNVQWQ